MNNLIKKSLTALMVLALITLLIPCTSDENKIKDNIETYFKARMEDPKSFELVDFQITDTVKGYLPLLSDEIDSKKGYEAFKKFDSKNNDSNGNTYNPNKIYMYFIRTTIRGRNSFNGMHIERYYVDVLNDKNFTILRALTTEEFLRDIEKKLGGSN